MTDKPYIIRVALSHSDADGEGSTDTALLNYVPNAATRPSGALMRRANLILMAWAQELIAVNHLERRTIATVVEYSDEQVFETDYLMEPERDQQGVNLGQSLWRSYAYVSGIYKPQEMTTADWVEWNQHITRRHPDRVAPLMLHNHPFDYEPTPEDLAHNLYPLNPDGTKPQ